MVEGNLFLSDRDLTGQSSGYRSLRDIGEFRGLSSLFPSASLTLLTRITAFASTKRLPAGSYLLPQSYEPGRRAKGKGGGTTVTIAARVLSENFTEEGKTIKTWQRHLDLACDMRLLKPMPQQYVVHSYGRPLAFLARESPEDVVRSDNWRAYFIDRLLYEDADWLQAALSLLSEVKEPIGSRELGQRMHEQVMDRIRQKTLPGGTTPRWAKRRLEDILRKMDEHHSPRHTVPRRAGTRRDDADDIPRRTELEFTVRRDWLVELGLVEMEDGMFRLTHTGQELKHNIGDRADLRLDFFTTQMAQLLASLVPDAQWKQPSEAIPILERLFVELTREPIRIIETLVLMNTAFFVNIPVFYGERQDILDALRQATKAGQTPLVLQSGQRTRDFYVKSRISHTQDS